MLIGQGEVSNYYIETVLVLGLEKIKLGRILFSLFQCSVPTIG